MEFIHDYVRFDFKRPDRLGRKNKRKVTIYFNALKEIRKFSYPVEPPRKATFQKVQSDVNPTFKKVHGKIAKTDFKVLFIPNNKKGVKFKRDRKRKKYVVTEQVGSLEVINDLIVFPVDELDDLVADTKNYIAEKVKGYPAGTQFRLYNPQDWRDGSSGDSGSVYTLLDRFMSAYPGSGLEKNRSESNVWGLVAETRKESKKKRRGYRESNRLQKKPSKRVGPVYRKISRRVRESRK